MKVISCSHRTHMSRIYKSRLIHYFSKQSLIRTRPTRHLIAPSPDKNTIPVRCDLSLSCLSISLQYTCHSFSRILPSRDYKDTIPHKGIHHGSSQYFAKHIHRILGEAKPVFIFPLFQSFLFVLVSFFCIFRLLSQSKVCHRQFKRPLSNIYKRYRDVTR